MAGCHGHAVFGVAMSIARKGAWSRRRDHGTRLSGSCADCRSRGTVTTFCRQLAGPRMSSWVGGIGRPRSFLLTGWPGAPMLGSGIESARGRWPEDRTATWPEPESIRGVGTRCHSQPARDRCGPMQSPVGAAGRVKAVGQSGKHSLRVRVHFCTPRPTASLVGASNLSCRPVRSTRRTRLPRPRPGREFRQPAEGTTHD